MQTRSYGPGAISTKALRWWPEACIVLVVGYVSLNRTFAYLGIRSLYLFPAEVFLAALLIKRPRAIFDRLLSDVMRPSPLAPFCWAFLAFAWFGVFLVWRGMAEDYSILRALENLVFNLYPVYVFVGIWVSRRSPDLFLRCIRALAWWNVIYGPVYVVFLNRLPIRAPWSPNVPLFPLVGGASLILLAAICLGPRSLGRYWVVPFSVNVFLLIAMQVRSDWLGFLLAVCICSLMKRRPGPVIATAVVFGGVLWIGYITDFRMPAPRGRGGVISSREVIGRALASVDPSAAGQFTANASQYGGTISWRTRWWRSIWDTTHQTTERALFGRGYGFPLGDLVHYLRNRTIRTPHNVFFYALGHGGWVGVALFFALQGALLRLLWHIFRQSGQPFGPAFWAMTLTGAFLGNVLETPFGAVPFYLLIGILVGPWLEGEAAFAASAQPHSVPQSVPVMMPVVES